MPEDLSARLARRPRAGDLGGAQRQNRFDRLTPDCAYDLVDGDPGAGDQLDQWQQQLPVSLGELLDCRSRGLLFSTDDVISFLHGGGVLFEGWFWRIDSIEPGSLPPLNLQLNLRHPLGAMSQHTALLLTTYPATQLA
jgi:hypothetical protein